MRDLLGLISLGLCVWVGIDSSNLGMAKGKIGGGFVDQGPVAWVVSCFFIWPLAFPLYLVARNKYKTAPVAWSMPAPAPSSLSYDAPVAQTSFGAGQFAAPAPAPVAEIPVQAAPVLTAPPQYSPDGHWWWTGQEWVAVPQQQAPPS